MIYRCCDERRRSTLENQSVFNGIDFLEVIDNPSDPDDVRQRTLLLHFLHPLVPGQLTPANIRITGGERIRNIVVIQVLEDVSASPPGDAKVLTVQVKQPGDFSPYTLSLVDSSNPSRPPSGFDPVFSNIEFSFKVACESNFDCRQVLACAPPPQTVVDISYLAKDYASFRQLMLDRMAKILPHWSEQNAADLGIVLVELLAYLGDYLSYQQDAVSTEAYLGTARRRTSVRRHVRLLDYPMHDGCNARTWVHFNLAPGVSNLTLSAGPGTQLLTKVNQRATGMDPSLPMYQEALNEKPQVFELAESATLFFEHNRMLFYTWGELDCCLPRGATMAYLRGAFPNLQPNDLLVLQEVRGAQTGVPEDADPTHRQGVRLTQVILTSDPIGGQFDQPPNNGAVAVTEIHWMDEDALTFPLCVSSTSGTEFYDDVSVALGNIALADHGMTIAGELLAAVPEPNPALTLAVASSGDPCPAADYPCHASSPQSTPSRYRPALQQSPLTFADQFSSTASATDILGKRQLDQLRPVIRLALDGDPDQWQPQRDLLKSGPEDKNFVVETENDGTAFLRFGDNVLGATPAPGSLFLATYRVGNGTAGNIGPDSLAHLASSDTAVISGVESVTNPLAAQGGLDPEPIEQVRQRAPYAFRTQERAVTAQDYGDKAELCDSTVQRATATFRWTGSWRTAFIAADRIGGAPLDDAFKDGLRSCMEQYRMAGQDVDVEVPAFVALEIAMDVCVKPDYFASDVETALLQLLSNCTLPDGRLGIFHPDNFTFGETVFLSPIYELVQQTDGVESVNITKFQRQEIDSTVALDSGKLELERLEVARLDNDPNFPEHGTLTLNMNGGR